MSELVHIDGKFVILSTYRGYVVYNKNRDFQNGHTHLRSYKMAMSVIHLVKNRIIPKNSGNYILTSLLRVSDNVKYSRKIEELLYTRVQKGVKDPPVKKKRTRKSRDFRKGKKYERHDLQY